MAEPRKPCLLIVEDDPGLQKQMRWSFDAYEVLLAGDRESAIAQLRRHEPAVVTMDLGLPPEPDAPTEGFRTLEEILSLAPSTKVITDMPGPSGCQRAKPRGSLSSDGTTTRPSTSQRSGRTPWPVGGPVREPVGAPVAAPVRPLAVLRGGGEER